MSNPPDHTTSANHSLIHEVRRIERPEIKNEHVARIPQMTQVRKPEQVEHINKYPPR